MTKQTDLEQVGKFWSEQSKPQRDPSIIYAWWQHPYIISKINERVASHPVGVKRTSHGLHQVVIREMKDALPFERGISVGCGSGIKEIELVKNGIVKHFDLYELSEARIAAGQKLVEYENLTKQVRFFHANAFEHVTASAQYDFVHWNNALHHMFDVFEAVEWSFHILKPSGVFYMDDYVGADRFQFSDKKLALANEALAALPEQYLQNPLKPGELLSPIRRRGDPEALKARDPSEAADSGRILDAVKFCFPDANIILTGGVIYFIALNATGILHNFSVDPVDPFLKLLMLLDFQAADAGLSEYAVALARKPS